LPLSIDAIDFRIDDARPRLFSAPAPFSLFSHYAFAMIADAAISFLSPFLRWLAMAFATPLIRHCQLPLSIRR
jgi:hypothetical protein